MSQGLCISFEGIDGCGKSSQASLCAEWLSSKHKVIRQLREPGGTSLGEYIRNALLDPSNADMCDESELLLYLAARAQLTSQVIRPALEQHEIVILDRYIDSTAAYQGYARGLGIQHVTEMNLFATGGLVPDITFIIDIDPEIALTRLTGSPDRLESEGIEFMNRVRAGYSELHRREPERIVFCDGSNSIEEIHCGITNVLTKRFKL